MSRILIRGAHVIASPQHADHGKVQSILIEGDTISALGEDAERLARPSDDILDGQGRIVIPGLVNAHMHSWQTGLRGIGLDWNLMEYLGFMHGRVMAAMRPEDVYIGNLAAALNQLNAGTTMLADWCHANSTPDHTEAAISALKDAGIRAMFLHATPMGKAQSREEVESLLRNAAFTSSGLLTLGLAIAGPLYSPKDIAEADLELARDLNLVATMHHSGGPGCPDEVWHDLIAKDLIGPRVNIVHGNTIGDDLMDRLVDAGATFTITPEVEMNDGHGHPITGRLRERGVAPAIGIDIECAIGPSVIGAAVVAMVHQRAIDAPQPGVPPQATAKRINRMEPLYWATGAGAHALGMGSKIGEIIPGKQADVTIIDGRALDLWPNNDPLATVLRSNSSHVETTIVAGRIVKRGGTLTDFPERELMDRLSESSQHILEAASLPEEAFN